MKTTIAKGLLSVKAVSLNVKEPCTWASDIKSPIYCDKRITLSYPKLRKEITKVLFLLFQKNIQKRM